MQNLGPESTQKELPGELNPAMTWADQFLQVTGASGAAAKREPHTGTSAGSACKLMLGWCGFARLVRPGCY